MFEITIKADKNGKPMIFCWVRSNRQRISKERFEELQQNNQILAITDEIENTYIVFDNDCSDLECGVLYNTIVENGRITYVKQESVQSDVSADDVTVWFPVGKKVKIVGLNNQYDGLIGVIRHAQTNDISVAFSDDDQYGEGFLPNNLELQEENLSQEFVLTVISAAKEKSLTDFAQILTNQLALQISQEFPDTPDLECGKQAKQTVMDVFKQLDAMIG